MNAHATAGALPPLDESAREAYARHARPRLMEVLGAVGLDLVYVRGLGDRLWYLDKRGGEVEVLDLVGGYGAGLLGHNHPALVERSRRLLDRGVPFLAQASARGYAGLLARRLSEAVGRSTGRSYVVTLASSGTEAVEAAIKHAELECAVRADAVLAGLRRAFQRVRSGLREHSVRVPEGLFPEAARLLDVPEVADLEDLFLRLFRRALDAMDREPVFLALEGSFHGKSTGALQLTHNPDYRSPWRRLGLRTVFLPRDEPEAAARAVANPRTRYLDLVVGGGGEVGLRERACTNITACFVEPVQGEGGIREVSVAMLRALRAAADEGGFPLVMDEIQCGMGRTGTFLASEPSGVRGDYYLLSKSLGGGLAKISALLVESGRYLADYGYLHTSTFAEDDPSSALALAVLELLEEGGGSLLGEAARKGEWLLGRLRGLAGRYPAQVAEVRGRGLMVGLELTRRPSPSPLLGLLGEQDLLGFLVAGHLLHVEGIRILPTLSRHSTIRIQPSVGIAMADLERLVASLGRVLEALRTGDVAYLAGYLVGRRATRAVPAPPDSPSPAPGPGPGPAQATPARRVGFLAHFLEAGDLGRFDPALADWGPEEAERFIRRTGSLLEPFVVDRSAFRSATGDSVELVVIGCAFTARQVMEGFRRGETASHVEQVERGVRLARGLGCTVVGLGGYTSIVTDAGRLLVEDQVALTTGNSLTVALAAEGLLQTARGRGLEPGRCRLGVVGATGNIGAVLAQCLMDEVGEVVLVGRPGSASRLEAAAEEVCLEAWRRLAQGHDRGLAARLAATGTVTALRAQAAAPGPVGRAIWEGLRAELGEATPVRCATDMGELRGCELVASASNAAEPVVRPEHLGEGTVVVCDVAVPRDVDPRVTVERPRATVIAGGIARAPLAQEVALRGMALAPGLVYGCMAETLLLGLTGITGHYSYGRLTTTQVRTMAELARIHGFRVEARHRKS